MECAYYFASLNGIVVNAKLTLRSRADGDFKGAERVKT